jgi:sterol desaturase/sphingolipid hydroxylase (fatty acid hydroxylase superfamily)
VDKDAAESTAVRALQVNRETAPHSLKRNILFAATLLALAIFGPYALYIFKSGSDHVTFISSSIGTTIYIGSLLFLSAVERILHPAGKRKHLSGWIFHFQMNLFYTIAFFVTSNIVIKICKYIAYTFRFERGFFDLRLTNVNGIFSVSVDALMVLFVGDFFFYWSHRLMHHSTFLWQVHKFHHMDTELEAISINRSNWIDPIVNAVTITLPMVLIFKLDRLDPIQLGIVLGLTAVFINTAFTLSHMNVRWGAGWANRLWCSPQVHRIHHSSLPEHHDRNFAFHFPVWDILFGTYYHPGKDEYPPTGVAGEPEINSFWHAQIFTLVEWRKMYCAWRDRRKR